MDHPDALRDPGDPDGSDGVAVDVGQGDRRGGGLRHRIRRPERLGRDRQAGLGRCQRRRHVGDPVPDPIEGQPRPDDPGREEQGLVGRRRDRGREHLGDLRLIGVARGSSGGVGATAGRDDGGRPPEPTAARRFGGGEVRLRQPDR